MSLFIDHKYLNILSSKLQQFKRKSRSLYNFRCPICGDSKKNKYKARGYVYEKKEALFFKCHNCSASSNVGNLIEKLDVVLSKQYFFEKYKNKNANNTEPAKEERIPLFQQPKFKKVDLVTIDSLSTEHPARKYLDARRLPPIRYHDLYYTDCFKTWVTKYDVELAARLKEEDPRIIIPFFDRDKNLVAAQGRSMANNTLRYFTIKIDKKAPKIFGLDRWDDRVLAYMTEGPFDSMFLPNAMAMAGSDLDDTKMFVGKNIVFVYDNEKRNQEIVNKMLKVLSKGFRIVVWPDTIKYKDINDMIVAGENLDHIYDTINENTFEGLQARLRINQWKRT
tara:strand:- start:3040 stop:4047 length:1008 start_codon:yes stop_codon:yes gene_type:complete